MKDSRERKYYTIKFPYLPRVFFLIYGTTILLLIFVVIEDLACFIFDCDRLLSYTLLVEQLALIPILPCLERIIVNYKVSDKGVRMEIFGVKYLEIPWSSLEVRVVVLPSVLIANHVVLMRDGRNVERLFIGWETSFSAFLSEQGLSHFLPERLREK